jgi:hypothetical protein
MSNLMTIHPVVAKLFHADGQTNMRKLIVAFRNFTNAPKTVNILRNDVFFNVAPFGRVEFCVTSHRTAYFIMPAMTSKHLTYLA